MYIIQLQRQHYYEQWRCGVQL